MTVKQKYSLWTAPADQSESPLGNINLKELEKCLAEIDSDQFKKDRKSEQKACNHEKVWKSTLVNLRGVYSISHNYLCMCCGLESESPIGTYKHQKINPNELENILNTQVD
ncbi:MAG: hypothetical protein Q8R00_02080 [Candidatus Nanoarchaeia archaeon]|nr:hypothetical protein [Candidatus Nanoarchaeia archaeon]